MSEILWCDLGDHQFSANDPKRSVQVEDITYEAKQNGERPKRYDMCGPCQANLTERGDPVQNFFKDIVSTRKAVTGRKTTAKVTPEEAQERGYDPDYVKWLEKQNGIK